MDGMCMWFQSSTKTWLQFPSLPAPRYAPATPIWRGRLHVVQGSKENRNAVAYDHWSIAVKDGKALDEWRKEVPIPRGGPQRFLYLLQSHLLCFEPYALLQSHR
ncbi:BnaA06g20820D [Brassica napus]|uniref:(rape) hypothetical protein n=1 Tax=Brassica napus TaxID=3708 RepID=A0A078GAS3_BRANA|nr:unnamed protein product [Brassica napus]CDY21813.1 BnaA06g20820D [Brassica napus]